MKEKQTEERIRQTAKHVFFAQGRFNAKMHEIAKEAGLNRALLHYYFRDRDNLFKTVLDEAMDESFIKMFAILSGPQAFEKKVEKAVHHIVDCLAEYPFMESFIISELNKDPSQAATLSLIKNGKRFTSGFLKETEAYLRKRRLSFIRPEHFIVNMMALCTYAFSTKPIIQNILGLKEKQYKAFILERKKTLPRLVLMDY
jgi:TetR/AcrR family transcriptional regulator